MLYKRLSSSDRYLLYLKHFSEEAMPEEKKSLGGRSESVVSNLLCCFTGGTHGLWGLCKKDFLATQQPQHLPFSLVIFVQI